MRAAHLTVAGLLGLAVLAPTSVAGPADAAGETCRGEAATIVGTTPAVVGTEGRDVIVTARATDVRGLGGDDLVCVVPLGTNSNFVVLDAGAGNDVVDTTAANESFYVTSVLGTGGDTLVGGVVDDRVYAGTGHASLTDSELDRVDTGAGSDQVSTGEPGTANRDAISLGSGMDTVLLGGPTLAPDAVIDAGADADVVSATTGDTDVAVDLVAGTMTTPAGARAIGGFESASFDAGTSRIGFRGTDGTNLLTVRSRSGAPTLRADLGAGDDTVHLEPAALAAGSDVDAGAGSDQVVAAAQTGFLSLDLKTDVLRTGSARSTATGFEDGFLMAPEAALVGDAQDNQLLFHGCEATMRGGHGDDSLGSTGDDVFDVYTFGCRARTTVHGGPGDDSIMGGQGADRLFGEGDRDTIEGRGGPDRVRGGRGSDRVSGGGARDHVRGDGGGDVLRGDEHGDVLLGGPGRDRADGSQGRDRCVAERELSCER